jgi:hypothetical protein
MKNDAKKNKTASWEVAHISQEVQEKTCTSVLAPGVATESQLQLEGARLRMSLNSRTCHNGIDAIESLSQLEGSSCDWVSIASRKVIAIASQ